MTSAKATSAGGGAAVSRWIRDPPPHLSLAHSRRRIVNRLAGPVLLGCTLVSAGTGVAALLFLARETFLFFSAVPLSRFFVDLSWTPVAEQPRFGVWPLLAGTVQLAAGETSSP